MSPDPVCKPRSCGARVDVRPTFKVYLTKCPHIQVDRFINIEDEEIYAPPFQHLGVRLICVFRDRRLHPLYLNLTVSRFMGAAVEILYLRWRDEARSISFASSPW